MGVPPLPALAIGRELLPTDAREAALLQAGAVGVPPLLLSEDELIRRNPCDVELYHALHRTLRHRVRAVETRMNTTIWDCTNRGRRTRRAV